MTKPNTYIVSVERRRRTETKAR